MKKIIVPISKYSYYEEKDTNLIKRKINDIQNKYGNIIDTIAKLEYLTPEIISSFIYIESGGNDNAINGNTVGLMQINTITAVETLYYEYKYNRITEEEENYLAKHIGDNKFSDIKSKAKLRIKSKYLTNELLKKPEVNIMLASMYLSQLFDRFTNNDGYIQLHKVVAAYNAGLFSKTLAKLKNIDINNLDTVINNINKITANYILKLAGKNGILTII